MISIMWLVAFIVITVVGGIALPGELGAHWVLFCWAVAIVVFLRRRCVKARSNASWVSIIPPHSFRPPSSRSRISSGRSSRHFPTCC
jgi:hypothetical protein